jgi:hypothetical protein
MNGIFTFTELRPALCFAHFLDARTNWRGSRKIDSKKRDSLTGLRRLERQPAGLAEMKSGAFYLSHRRDREPAHFGSL